MSVTITIDTGTDLYRQEVTIHEALFLVQSMETGIDSLVLDGFCALDLPDERWEELMSFVGNTGSELAAKAAGQP